MCRTAVFVILSCSPCLNANATCTHTHTTCTHYNALADHSNTHTQPEDIGPDRYGAVTAPAAGSADTTSTATKRSFKEMGFGSDDSSDEEDNDTTATANTATAGAASGEQSDGTAHPTSVPQGTVPPAAVTLAKKASMKGIGFSRLVCIVTSSLMSVMQCKSLLLRTTKAVEYQCTISNAVQNNSAHDTYSCLMQARRCMSAALLRLCNADHACAIVCACAM
jgi:hypothetical protein